jgi:hypothetical protein
LREFANLNKLKRQNKSVQSLEHNLEELIKSNLTTPSILSCIPDTFFSQNNKTLLYDNWLKYLSENPYVEGIMCQLPVDPLLFFFFYAISISLWGFGFGAASCCIPELVPLGIMFVEALILGLASSLLVDVVCSSEIPFINALIGIMCNITNLSKIQIEIMTGSLCCLIVMGTYLWLWELCPNTELNMLVKLIGGGSILIGPPFLFSWLLSSLFYPQPSVAF